MSYTSHVVISFDPSQRRESQSVSASPLARVKRALPQIACSERVAAYFVFESSTSRFNNSRSTPAIASTLFLSSRLTTIATMPETTKEGGNSDRDSKCRPTIGSKGATNLKKGTLPNPASIAHNAPAAVSRDQNSDRIQGGEGGRRPDGLEQL